MTVRRGPILREGSQGQPDSSEPDAPAPSFNKRPHADAEMARVLRTKPVSMAKDSSSGAITFWKHDPLHDVVGAMADHVIMAFPGAPSRFERRSGKEHVTGTARSGTVTVIPAGSTSRWDIFQPLTVVQLYLPQTTLLRVAAEAGMAGPDDLVERTANPDLITSRLLLSAVGALDGSAVLDSLFRHQLTDLVATRLLAAYSGSFSRPVPIIGGLSPKILARAIERLRSDVDADLSLSALASDAALSRFHFCRAFKESTGVSPHAWLRQHRLEQAMQMLRETDDSILSIAAALGYASQTAFAAAFKKLTGESPSVWRTRVRK
ncbi:helix-turn-helix transcriptional regulator [Bradyrhizobium sp. 1(2017)]|uniref:helix-turn-helix transcriptional regulator n=1 Tax=Bradyrhizobium sp. 1(2017) TaxID=1404888 RepID=UPI00140F0261|nr:AraC family transcriptional regulator [Bradyrhizobium sp. 1(2017)]QIO32320.1 helix-turn-helix transcriptional regulator [Bradyrhizobium sp. 1(2017)]